MRVSKKELMDKLNVGYELGSYETCPWSCYDGDSGRTCSAEVRMDPDGTELEAEIQMMYDTPPEGKPPMEGVFIIRARPSQGDNWEILTLKIRGEAFGTDVYNWQEKSCDFFSAVTQELQLEKIPDIDELIDLHFHSREKFAGGSQGGGGKAPKIEAGQVMGMNKGGGGF